MRFTTFIVAIASSAVLPMCLHAQAPAAPLSVDLRNALARARAYNAQFLASATAVGLAHEDRLQAKGALLPSVNDVMQYIYTQGNGTPSGVFVGNDGVHVYNEQAQVHAELYAPGKLAEYRRTIAAEAVAQAKRDVAIRGLASTVVQNYYAIITAQRHLENARQSVQEAQRFFDITRQQEQGGEVAHADVIKAQIQLQQRQRELVDVDTALARAKLVLGVMLFPDLSQQFSVVDDLKPDAPLPIAAELQTRALTGNPDIRAAEAGVTQANLGVTVNRAAYLPTLSVDYFYGINANVFAIHGPEDRENLGSVVQGTLTVPLWNWGANRSKVRAAELGRQQAQAELSLARRQAQSDIQTASLEVQAARSQLESLRSSLDLTTESLRLILLRYQSGESTALEVVDAQSSLAAARNAYDDGLARYRLALANIEVLTGGL